MKKKIVWAVVVIVVVVLIGWGMVKNTKTVDGEKIKVGAVLPFSGNSAFYGDEIKKGMEMCNPGNLEYVYEDSVGSPATGISAFNKITQIDKVDVTIVGMSTVVPAILPIAKDKKDFVIATMVTAADVGKTGGDTVFRYYSDGYKAAQVISDSMVKYGAKNIGILYVQNDFGETYKKGAEDFLKNKDVVIYPESFLATEVDFSTSLLKLKQNKVDAIMIVAYDKQTLQIITKIKDLKLEADVFSAWMWNDSDFEKNPEIFNGVYAARSYFLSGSGDKVVNFKTDFMAKYNSIPSQFAAIGCDLAILLGENNIRTPEQLTSLESFNGINGKIIQAEYGEFDFPIQVIQYKRDETKSLN
jgi:branched-chain amino acid transport system substrate-binding protein